MLIVHPKTIHLELWAHLFTGGWCVCVCAAPFSPSYSSLWRRTGRRTWSRRWGDLIFIRVKKAGAFSAHLSLCFYFAHIEKKKQTKPPVRQFKLCGFFYYYYFLLCCIVDLPNKKTTQIFHRWSPSAPPHIVPSTHPAPPYHHCFSLLFFVFFLLRFALLSPLYLK